MNRKLVYFLASGVHVSIRSVIEKLTSVPTEELKNLVTVLEKEYGITVYTVEKPDPKELFAMLEKKHFETKVLPLENLPSYPVSPKIFSENQKRRKFAPPNKGKINTKPKGRFKK